MRKKTLFVLIFLSFCIFLFFPISTRAESNKKTLGIGLGISNAIPTTELNLSMEPMPFKLNYRYYLTKGFELSLKIYAIQKKHIHWHILSPGLYFLMGTEPLSVSNTKHNRGMDISFGTGMDILPWKNLVISVSFRWFLPGMSSAYAVGQEAALKYTMKNFEIDPDKSWEEIIQKNGKAAFEIAMQKTKKIYKQVMREPQIQFTLTWYFF